MVCVNSRPPLLSSLPPPPPLAAPLSSPFDACHSKRSKLGLCSRQNQAGGMGGGGYCTATPKQFCYPHSEPRVVISFSGSILPAIWRDNDFLSILRTKIELPVDCLQYCVVRKSSNTALVWISNNDKIFWCLFSFDAGYWPYHVVTWRSCYGECKADTGQRNTHRRC